MSGQRIHTRSLEEWSVPRLCPFRGKGFTPVVSRNGQFPAFDRFGAKDSHLKSRGVPSSLPLLVSGQRIHTRCLEEWSVPRLRPFGGKGFTLVVSRNGQFPAFARFGAQDSHSLSRGMVSSPPLPVSGRRIHTRSLGNGQFPAFTRFGAKDSQT